MPDHVHLLVTIDPQYGIHRLVKQIKGRSSRLLRQQFPAPHVPDADPMDQQLPRRHHRRPTQEMIKKYVENQHNV